MKAPLAWPNSSLSRSSGDREGQDSTLKGRFARELQPWMARARTPLPVPLSPRSSRVASEGAVSRARLTARLTAGLSLEKSASRCERPRSSRREATFCSSERISNSFCTASLIWAGVKGFGM